MRYVSCMTENQQTEWVWRPGFGWVERPVVTVEDDEQVEQESFAA